jgi:hypothetical protein
MLAVRVAGPSEMRISDGQHHVDMRNTTKAERYQAEGSMGQIEQFRFLFDSTKAIFDGLSKYNCDVHALCKVEDGKFSIEGKVEISSKQYSTAGPEPAAWLDEALRALMKIADSTDLSKGSFLLVIEQTVTLVAPKWSFMG